MAIKMNSCSRSFIRRDPFKRTVAVYMLFLPTFYFLLQPNATLKPVLSPNSRQLLLISSLCDATKGSCWFTQQNVVPSYTCSPLPQWPSGNCHWWNPSHITNLPILQLSPQQWESWQNEHLDAQIQSQLTKRAYNQQKAQPLLLLQLLLLLLVILQFKYVF